MAHAGRAIDDCPLYDSRGRSHRSAQRGPGLHRRTQRLHSGRDRLGFLSFLVSQPILAGSAVPSASLGQPGVLRAVIGSGLYLAAVALLGLALGLLIRSTAGALIILVTATFIVTFFLGQFLPPLARACWPPMAGLMVMSTNPNIGVPPWGAFAIMVVGVGALFALASVIFRRRDA